MADKVVFPPISSFTNDSTATTQTNANYVLMQNAIDNSVSRDGTQPNSMSANLDMNSNHLLNLPAPSSSFEPMRLADVNQLTTGNVTLNNVPTGGLVNQVLAKNSSANFDTSWQSISSFGIDALFSTSQQGDVPASGGGTVNFLRADGSWTSPAVVINANNIVGNNTGSPAPAIGLTATQTNNVLSAAAWNDVSTVIGSKPTFWTSSGAAIVSRFNRVFIGEAALGGSQQTPSPKDWLENLAGGSVSNSQLAVVSALGTGGVLGGSRTSDYRTAFGSASPFSLGIQGWGVNDDSGAGYPIAQGMTAYGVRKTGIGGTTQAIQTDINNGGSVVDVNPYDGYHAGSTIGINITAGSLSGIGTANPSAAMVVGTGAVGAFRRGIVITSGSLDSTIGTTGGIALDTYNASSIRWTDGSGNPDAEMFGNVLAIANGANALAMRIAGMIMVQDQTDGSAACYLCSGNSAGLIFAQGGNWVASTTSPLAGKLSVAYNGSTGYSIYNNQGASRTIVYHALQLGTSS